MADDVFGILRPANTDPKKTVIVLGAPRGGTSMVAATLRKLGVMMGEKLGHQHEDPSFRRDVPLSDMIATVERRNSTYDLWGWKFPNSVYNVEELLPYLRNPHFVAVFRNPYSTSRSSAERDHRDYNPRLLQVAANHTKMVTDLIGRLIAPTALAAFESAMRNPTEFVRGLANFIGLQLGSDLLQKVVDDAISINLGYVSFTSGVSDGPLATQTDKTAVIPVCNAAIPPGHKQVPETTTIIPVYNSAITPAYEQVPEASERKVKRTERVMRVAAELQNLPTRIENPFFRELQARWPEMPTLHEPVSQLCTTSQFGEPDYQNVCSLLQRAKHLNRKQWEHAYIYRSLEQAGMIAADRRGLVFGVGRERLPALFVSKGCQIVATDLPGKEGDGAWVGGAQHADSLDKIFYPKIVYRRKFYRNASFQLVNMKSIPEELTGFSFCWSACALEHLGSLRHGLDFIVNSLKCLRPGGVAVHTTEFNLGSDTDTLEDGPSVVYRERDLIAFAKELRDQGHEITLNLHPGTEPTDLMVDRDRNSDVHLRIYVRHKVLATSIGLCIRKAA